MNIFTNVNLSDYSLRLISICRPPGRLMHRLINTYRDTMHRL